jgi:hypothetical protein
MRQGKGRCDAQTLLDNIKPEGRGGWTAFQNIKATTCLTSCKAERIPDKKVIIGKSQKRD